MTGPENGGVKTRRVDIQASVFAAVLAVISCAAVFLFCYHVTYQNMLDILIERVNSIYHYAENYLNADAFIALRDLQDMDSVLYRADQARLNSVRQATGVRYLYTATETDQGDFIYLVDGLDLDAEDFRRPGDAIEPEIIPELRRAMGGESVFPRDIKPTDWGKIFIAYLPVHDGNRVAGVIGIEFEAEAQYNAYRLLRFATPAIILAVCLLASLFSFYFFRRISNPNFRDLSNTDRLTQFKNRNSFDLDLHNLDACNRREGIGILFADLNHLKEVNDTLGHTSGDLYLRLAAAAIENACQGVGIPYRVGGDEFAVLTSGADLQALQRISAKIATQFVRLRPTWSMDIGVSIGVAVFDPNLDQDLFSTFCRADETMYREKKAGREQARWV